MRVISVFIWHVCACLLFIDAFSQTTASRDNGLYSIVENYKIFNYSSPVELTVKSVYTGSEAEKFRETLVSKNARKLQDSYLKYYRDIYPGISITRELNLQKAKDKNQITITEYYTIPKFFSQDSISGAYKADFYSDYVSSILPKLTADIKKPLYVGYSNIDHSISLEMPGKWNIDSESKEVANDNFNYQYEVYESGDMLSLHFRFQYLKEYVGVREYPKFAADVKSIQENYLGYAISHIPESIPFYPNYPLILSACGLIVLLGITSLIIYYKTGRQGTSLDRPIPLGGWLLVVIISLIATIYNEAKELSDLDYLDLNTWEFYSARQSSTFYKITLTTKVVATTYVICFALFCIFLIIKQRDILPRLISFYFASSAILTTVIHILTTRLYGENPTSINNVLFLVISSFIWMYYFRTSERVKATFVVKRKPASGQCRLNE
jgi:hypothetical protein